MTKQELEKAIENCDTVYIYNIDRNGLGEIHEKKLDKTYINVLDALYYDWVFKTKAEAEHYLHHANISRTETLPFLTWEEFLKEYSFDFYSSNHEWFTLYWNDVDGIVLENIISIDDKKTWDLTEENFYKAYDECVRLFKGEE